MRKLGIISLENEGESQLEGGGEGVVEDNANSAETAMLEVADSEAEGAEGDAAVDEAVEAVSSLEAYCVALEAANATGGLTREGAAVMNIGLEHIYSQLGFRKEDTKVVSMENFGQASSRANATQIAMESVKDKLKEIWAAIIAHIKKAIEWVKGHFNKIFGTAERLQKRAKALSQAAGSANVSGQPKEKTFENERLVKALHINGAIPADLPKELTKIKTVADNVFTQIADFNGKGAEALLEEMGKTDGKLADIKTVPLPQGAVAKVNNPKGAGFAEPVAGLSLFRGPVMLGNKAVIVEAPSQALSGEQAVTPASKTSMALGAFDPKASEPSGTTVHVIDGGKIAAVADEVDAMMTDVIKYRAKLGKFGDLKSKIVAAAERAGKDSNTEENKDKAAWHGAMQKIATNVVNNLDRGPAAMSIYVLNTAKAALDLAEQSLKQYTANKK